MIAHKKFVMTVKGSITTYREIVMNGKFDKGCPLLENGIYFLSIIGC